jgi:hypothetical protein
MPEIGTSGLMSGDGKRSDCLRFKPPRPVRSAAICDVEAATSDRTRLPRFPHHPSGVPCPLPRRIERVHLSIASPSVRPSPFCRRVGIRISTFEACSGFTRVTAPRIAQPPKVAFVTRLRSSQSPSQTARQLPEQSTIRWVEPASTGEPRLSGRTAKILINSAHATSSWPSQGGVRPPLFPRSLPEYRRLVRDASHHPPGGRSL